MDDAPQATLTASFDPKRSVARIRFRVSAAGAAAPLEVAVLDLAGRSVRTLARESVSAGEHERTWDLRDENGARVAHGMYFVRLSTRDASRVTKVAVW